MAESPKLYKSKTTLTLRAVDVNLLRAVIDGLGELSGNEIEMLGAVQDIFEPGDDAPSEVFHISQRANPTYQVETPYEIETTTVQFILASLFSQVKSFTARDIGQVREIRKRLSAALAAAVDVSTGTESETEDTNNPEE